MVTFEQLEKEIQQIKERNKKVEMDKRWEISGARKILLITFTYLAIGSYLLVIRVPNPWLNAFVPAVGFLLSTLTLPYFKNLRQRYLDTS